MLQPNTLKDILLQKQEQALYPCKDENHVGQTDEHFNFVNRIFNLLKYFFRNLNVYINHDIMLYYEESNKKKYICPDIMLIKDPLNGIYYRDTYLLWNESCPNVIMEVVSKSNKEKDHVRNVSMFKSQIPVKEYIIIDFIANPAKVDLYRYRNAKIISQDSGVKIYSHELDMEILIHNQQIEFYHKGEKVPDEGEGERNKGMKNGLKIAEERGIRIGEERGFKETAEKMKKEGSTIDLIKKITGLAETVIEEL